MKPVLFASVAFAALSSAAFADISVANAYMRSSNPKVAAAFMEIANTGAEADRLVSATSDIAARVELHTHEKVGDVMKMVEVEEGFTVPAGETLLLERGGFHVMFMGLAEPLKEGDAAEVTLIFEAAGEMTVSIPFDNSK